MPRARLQRSTNNVRIAPQEPNAQDSLGGGAARAHSRFKDAEAAFQKALDLSPQFFPAHEGIAYAKFYAGDWAGGRDALTEGEGGSPKARGQVSNGRHHVCGGVCAEEKRQKPSRYLDAAAKTEGADPVGIALNPIPSGVLLSS